MSTAGVALLAILALAVPADADPALRDAVVPSDDVSPRVLPATGQSQSFAKGDDGELRLGAELRYRDNGDGTIADLVTGLCWEKKCLQCANLHDAQRLLPSSAPRSVQVQQWLAEVNAEGGAGYAGHGDWRIPSNYELESIRDYGRELNRSSPSYVNESDAIFIPFPWALPRAVRCPALAGTRFRDNGDGTVSDLSTELMWEKKTTDAGSLHDIHVTLRWQGDKDSIWEWLATVNAEGGTGYAGHADWRIPNARELHTLLPLEPMRFDGDVASEEKGLDPVLQPTTTDPHWSSTTVAGRPEWAWALEPGSRTLSEIAKHNGLRVLAVRGGPTQPARASQKTPTWAQWATYDEAGLVALREQRYADAEKAFRQAIVAARGMAEGAVKEAASQNNLGLTFFGRRNYREAAHHYKAALRLYAVAVPPDDPRLAGPTSNLALAYHLERDYTRAKALYRRAIALQEKASWPDRSDLSATLENYLLMLRITGRVNEAAEIETRVRTLARAGTVDR